MRNLILEGGMVGEQCMKVLVQCSQCEVTCNLCVGVLVSSLTNCLAFDLDPICVVENNCLCDRGMWNIRERTRA